MALWIGQILEFTLSLHFREEETETQRDEVLLSKSKSLAVSELESCLLLIGHAHGNLEICRVYYNV